MLFNGGVGEDSWESLGLQRDPTSPSWGKSVLNIHWKDWCWSWNSNSLLSWCEELTHLKRPWCWERLRAGGEGDDRGWDVWMASLTQWTWVWVNSRSWRWTGRPGVLQSMGSQKVGHDWATELKWAEQRKAWYKRFEKYLCTGASSLAALGILPLCDHALASLLNDKIIHYPDVWNYRFLPPTPQV